jgi:hypothetical protein
MFESDVWTLIRWKKREALRPRCFAMAAARTPWIWKVGHQADGVPANALARLANKNQGITRRLFDL